MIGSPPAYCGSRPNHEPPFRQGSARQAYRQAARQAGRERGGAFHGLPELRRRAGNARSRPSLEHDTPLHIERGQRKKKAAIAAALSAKSHARARGKREPGAVPPSLTKSDAVQGKLSEQINGHKAARMKSEALLGPRSSRPEARRRVAGSPVFGDQP